MLVCDNASYHHARIVQGYLETVENRVFVFWLPAYAPELNLIERVWKRLKQVGLNNFYFETLKKLEQAVHHVFDAVNLKKITLQIAFEKYKELCAVT